MPFACVLISDITGSTQLYEAENGADALEQITIVLNRMRQIIEDSGGHCVKSQGDDVLSYFDQADPAFQAAMTMIHEDWHGALSVHVGMYVGDILSQDGDIYGRPVNTAARLASMAKPGEILLGDACFDQLEPVSKRQLAMIGELPLKGKNDPTRVYSCSAVDMSDQTVIVVNPKKAKSSQTEAVSLTYNDQNWQVSEGETLSIGRSDYNDIVMGHAWVSRKHAAVSVRRGQLEFSDHSSTGSVVQTDEGKEISIHRRATLLNGSGLIFLGSGARKEESSALTFDTKNMKIQYASD
ncbi:MAG: adenylate cyclase [Paracoccaceae bacterium]|jgi:adenylate cyclase